MNYTCASLDSLIVLIEELFPLPKKIQAKIPKDVAELSQQLTSARGNRHRTYLNDPRALTAYLRYFLPWNVYRLGMMLPNLSLPLQEGSRIADLGAGPFTFALALWIYCPELRRLPLEFLCIDSSSPALEAGNRIIRAIGTSPWTMRAISKAVGGSAAWKPREKADLVCALNFYNEQYWDLPHTRPLGEFAYRAGAYLSSLATSEGAILVMEPGIPRSGEFIAALRGALIAKGYTPQAPCPHAGPCPCPGGKDPRGGNAKWCHFAGNTSDAPPALQKLSAAAGLPKDRVAYSYLLAGKAEADPAPANMSSLKHGEDRIVVLAFSNTFPITGNPGQQSSELYGRYGCTEKGLALITGRRAALAGIAPGSRIALRGGKNRDSKSGAWVFPLQGAP